jgi:hypothetical protein
MKMQGIRKHKVKFKIMTIFALLFFSSSAFSAGLSTDRILPKGKVTLYQEGQRIGQFASEAPLPEDTFISVQGECGVKMKNLFLVAADKSLFSITTAADSRKLTIKQGTVYFALSAMQHTLVFQTPDGAITTHEIMINASADAGLLKGYVSVLDGATKIGVFEGGSLVLIGNDGKAIRIKSGQELKLAQVDIIPETTEEPAPTGVEEGVIGGISGQNMLIGLGVLVGVGGLAAAAGGGGGSGSGQASPSTP